MKKFMDNDFLLHNKTAIDLYNNYASKMPIYDYHCHLSSKEIYENKSYDNITQVWLYGDHYKWRAMRSMGINEEYITGNKSDYEKFLAWAKTISLLIGNPLYHWTHLELKRYFNIEETLSIKTADIVWNKANNLLQGEGYRVRDFIEKSDVKLICTTDDPTDSLEYHKKIAQEGKMKAKVLPTFRPDKAVEINKDGFVGYINNLSEVVGYKIDSVQNVVSALNDRITYFNDVGCKLSDHGLDYVPYRVGSIDEINDIFKMAMNGEKVSFENEEVYKTFILRECAKSYASLGWTMQLHMGALRNNNTKMFERLGADTGFDSINDLSIAKPLSQFLNSLECENKLSKTILYTLNPKDNYVLATMLGNFQSSEAIGKIQFGSAWWFNDQKDGMIEQMKALANLGLLSKFVGMLTDSRSFLSYTRHEYFRRIMCNLIGSWVECGEFPDDFDVLKEIVEGICFNNAKEYFKITL